MSAGEPPVPVYVRCPPAVKATDEPCAGSYEEGTELTLEPVAGEHSEFGQFENATGETAATECSGTPSSCEFTIEEATEIDAVFDLIPHTLTVVPSGEGSVGADSGEISGCEEEGGGTCAGGYGESSIVTLTATPGEHRETVWTSGCDNVPSADECEVEIPAGDATVEVEFAKEPNVHVTIDGEGSGEVVGVEPETNEYPGTPRLECAWNGETEVQSGACDVVASTGFIFTGISAKAIPAEGSKFTGWTKEEGTDLEGCEFTEEEATFDKCTLFILGEEEIKLKATFEPIPKYALTIDTGAGTGTGQVNCDVNGGEATDEPCAGSYEEGTELTLEPVAGEHSEFVQFENATGETAATECSGTPSSCEFTIEEATEIDAVFDLIPHTLTVVPSGEGSVGADSGEISGCEEEGGGTCAGGYGESSIVTLTATPGEHRETVWTSGCDNVPSTDECEVEIPAGDATVEVEFAEAPKGTLTVEASGAGSVSAEASPTPESGEIAGCEEGGGSECSAEYFQGETVTLVASPGAHKETVWTSGCDNVSGDECEVEVDGAAVSVEVEFPQVTHTLSIVEAGNGNGAVACNIDGGGFGSCAGPIDEGSSVEVEATPGAHSTFDGFSAGSNSASGCSSSPCMFTLEEDSALTATFTQITHTLTVSTAGSGSGTVSCDGGACAASYPEGEEVTLTASADSGSSFAGWSGDCSGSGACVITIDADATVTATFDATPEPPPGGGDNGGGSTPPPAETCLTNAALCKPGLLIANPAAWVKGNKALLKVRCRGEQGARCRSTLKLIAKVRVHGKKKNVVVGKSRYNLPTNSSVRVLRAKLTRGGLKLVHRAGRRGLRVKLLGKHAKNRVVKLKQRRGMKRKRQGRRRRGR